MCRSSRVTLFLLTLLLSTSAEAQVYGFPSDVGVIDDGYGTLPPTPPPFPAGLAPAEAPRPLLLPPSPPPPCSLVIKVGRGLQHPARARVVYGRPSPCS